MEAMLQAVCKMKKPYYAKLFITAVLCTQDSQEAAEAKLNACTADDEISERDASTALTKLVANPVIESYEVSSYI